MIWLYLHFLNLPIAALPTKFIHYILLCTQKHIYTYIFIYTHILLDNVLPLSLKLNANMTVEQGRKMGRGTKGNTTFVALPLSHLFLLIFQVLCETLSLRLQGSL